MSAPDPRADDPTPEQEAACRTADEAALVGDQHAIRSRDRMFLAALSGVPVADLRTHLIATARAQIERYQQHLASLESDDWWGDDTPAAA